MNDTFPMSSNKFEEFEQETSKDPEVQNLWNYLLKRWPNSRSLCGESVKCYWNFRDEIVTIDAI